MSVLLGTVWVLLGTVVGMVLAFGHLSHTEMQSEVLATDIGIALYTTAAGIIVCPIGITIVVAVKLSKMNEASAVANFNQQS